MLKKKHFFAIEEYKKLLILKVGINDCNATLLSPSFKVDQVWHMHMMHPKKYYADCLSLCGQIIDHNPLGSKGDDAAKREDRFLNTKKLYFIHFNEIPQPLIWDENFIPPVNQLQVPNASPRNSPSCTGSMQIFVILTTRRTATLTCCPSDTVLKIKSRIKITQGMLTDDFYLLHGGKHLQENLTLFDYNIKKESTIQIVIRLRGC